MHVERDSYNDDLFYLCRTMTYFTSDVYDWRTRQLNIGTVLNIPHIYMCMCVFRCVCVGVYV